MGKSDAVDPAALARAEAALQALSGEFAGWMEEELGRLEAACSRLRAGDADPAAWNELHLRAHDLKGLGATYGHPLATRLCASLCRLLDDPATRTPACRPLAEAHVAAVRATTDRTPGEVEGARLCEALEAHVDATLGRRTG